MLELLTMYTLQLLANTLLSKEEEKEREKMVGHSLWIRRKKSRGFNYCYLYSEYP
jgi:hypothetical protein